MHGYIYYICEYIRRARARAHTHTHTHTHTHKTVCVCACVRACVCVGWSSRRAPSTQMSWGRRCASPAACACSSSTAPSSRAALLSKWREPSRARQSCGCYTWRELASRRQGNPECLCARVCVCVSGMGCGVCVCVWIYDAVSKSRSQARDCTFCREHVIRYFIENTCCTFPGASLLRARTHVLVLLLHRR